MICRLMSSLLLLVHLLPSLFETESSQQVSNCLCREHEQMLTIEAGTWQGIWYLEFRAMKHQRRVVATIQGERA